MATLYQCSKSGKFYANYIGLDGERRRESLKTKDQDTAEALLANIITQEAHARILGVENIEKAKPVTFKAFVETVFLPHCAANLKTGTYANYLDYSNKAIPVLGEKFMGGIGPKDIGAFLDELKNGTYKRGKSEFKYTVATLNRYKNFLSGVFSHALDNESITKHPMTKKKRFKNKQENNLRTRSMTTQEEEKLLTFAPCWFVPMIRLALATGMRRGELLSLRRQDIDVENRKIWLRNTKSGKDQSIPLNRTAQAILEAVDPAVADGKALPWVFVDPVTSKPYTRYDLDYAMRSTVEKAGLEDLHFHDLRHTAGTRAYRATKDIKAVQKLLRHSSLAVTLRYVHDAEDDLQAAVDALNDSGNRSNRMVTGVTPKPVTEQNVRKTSEKPVVRSSAG